MPRFLDTIQYYDDSGTLRTVEPSEPLYSHYIAIEKDDPDVLIAFSLISSISTPATSRTTLFNILDELNTKAGGQQVSVTASGTFKSSVSAPPFAVAIVEYQNSNINIKGYATENGLVASISSTLQTGYTFNDSVVRLQ